MKKYKAKKLLVLFLLLGTMFSFCSNDCSAIVRKLFITNDSLKRIGYANAVVEWGLIFTDTCDGGTVSEEPNYPNASIKVTAMVKNVAKKTVSASGQIRAMLPTPLQYNCDQFVTVHKLSNGKKTYSITMRT